MTRIVWLGKVPPTDREWAAIRRGVAAGTIRSGDEVRPAPAAAPRPNRKPETPGQALARERTKSHREADRRKVRELRAELRAARAHRRAELARIARECREARGHFKEWAPAERARVRDLIRAERERIGSACRAARGAARLEGDAAIDLSRQAIEEERRFQALLRETSRRERAKLRKTRATKREAREESDSHVARNVEAIDPSLVPIWYLVSKNFEDEAHRSRTEAFLQWAEENEHEIHRLRGDAAEAAAEEEIARYLAQANPRDLDAARAMIDRGLRRRRPVTIWLRDARIETGKTGAKVWTLDKRPRLLGTVRGGAEGADLLARYRADRRAADAERIERAFADFGYPRRNADPFAPVSFTPYGRDPVPSDEVVTIEYWIEPSRWPGRGGWDAVVKEGSFAPSNESAGDDADAAWALARAWAYERAGRYSGDFNLHLVPRGFPGAPPPPGAARRKLEPPTPHQYRRRNPKKKNAARRAFTDFHWGDPPERLRRVTPPNPAILYELGALRRVDYETTKDGERAVWFHDFERPYPTLTATPGGDLGPILPGGARVRPEGITG